MWSLPANFQVAQSDAVPAASNLLPMLSTELLAEHLLTTDDFFGDKSSLDQVLLIPLPPHHDYVAAESDPWPGENPWFGEGVRNFTEEVGDKDHHSQNWSGPDMAVMAKSSGSSATFVASAIARKTSMALV